MLGCLLWLTAYTGWAQKSTLLSTEKEITTSKPPKVPAKLRQSTSAKLNSIEKRNTNNDKLSPDLKRESLTANYKKAELRPSLKKKKEPKVSGNTGTRVVTPAITVEKNKKQLPVRKKVDELRKPKK